MLEFQSLSTVFKAAALGVDWTKTRVNLRLILCCLWGRLILPFTVLDRRGALGQT